MLSPSARLAIAAVALASAACDQVYGLHGRTDGDAGPAPTDASRDADALPSTCLTEDFETTFVELAARWDRYTGATVAPAGVDVANGGLVFKLPQGVPSNNYAGIIRIGAVDFTNATMTLEIVEPTQRPSNFELFMKLYDDVDNDRYYQALLGGSMMHFIQVNQGLTSDTDPFTFDPVSHRFWRVRHSGTGEMLLETSADNVQFVERLSRPAANVPITQLRLEIGSGTHGSNVFQLNPIVDNFAFCPSR